MRPLLAIVIPYYKLAFFEATLVSLAKQTDKRFRVYIGDDASNEPPEFLLERYKGQFDFTYHRFETNLGKQSLTQQWDRCIALANDEPWLMLLGDDDVLGEDVVSSFYKYYDVFESQSQVVRFSTVVIDAHATVISSIFTQPQWEDAYTSYYKRIAEGHRSTLSEYIFSKASYLQFGFVNYPLAWHSDDRAWLDFSNNQPIYSINDANVYIRMSDIHITGKTDNLAEKHCAQLLFYKYLVASQLYRFSKLQQAVILLKYEKLIFAKRPLNYNDYLYLMFYYVKTFNFKGLWSMAKQTVKFLQKNFK